MSALRFFFWLLCGCGLVFPVYSQLVPAETPPVYSLSGQFVVPAQRALVLSRLARNLGTNQHYVRLEPTLLTVSCERIKQVLWRELEVTTPWRGKIFLALYPVETPDDTITIVSEHYKEGWRYRVDLPNMVERSRYVRAITQVLLLELANRTAGERSAEIPPWLSEGLARQLLASSSLEIILPPPDRSVNGVSLTSTNAILNGWRDSRLAQAHQELSTNSCLTFQELSWPSEAELANGEAGEVYRSSAQVFVDSLLRLKDGRACLRATIAELPQHYNWQLAFLNAFQAHFRRPLEVEKWWALRLAQFTGHDLAQNWPAEESWQKLDEALRSPVQIRTATNEPPLHAEMTLQAIVSEWDRPTQSLALQDKLRELEMLRLRVTPDLVPLVDNYHRTIQTFLQQRDRTGSVLPFSKRASRQRLAQETVKQLKTLDAQRQALRPQKPAIPAQAALDANAAP